MRYEGDIYSPNIAGDDFILQCTIGCSHNRCTFCYMYKTKTYRVRQLNEIFQDIALAKAKYGDLEKVFLADGDALGMKTADLLAILDCLYNTFPSLSYVGVYASAINIADKTLDDLTKLRNHGLIEAHLGIESGDNEVLRAIRKGVTSTGLLQAGLKIRQAGIKICTTIILGMAGRSPERALAHAQNTARLCNEIQPDEVGLLTVIVQPGTELYEAVQRNQFEIPKDMEILKELSVLIRHLDLKHSGITSIHPSNCICLEGWLPDDKEIILSRLEHIIANKDSSQLRARVTKRV